jgi:hypothetical protein
MLITIEKLKKTGKKGYFTQSFGLLRDYHASNRLYQSG